MPLEGAFNLNETYKRLLPGFIALSLALYTIYEINRELINKILVSPLISAGALIIAGVFFGAVLYLLAFDEICPTPSSVVDKQVENLKNEIIATQYDIPNELQDKAPTSIKVPYLHWFSSIFRDYLVEPRLDEYEFSVAQYQSYAQLASILFIYAFLRILIYIKFFIYTEFRYDFSLGINILIIAPVFIFLIFLMAGGFEFLEPILMKYSQGIKREPLRYWTLATRLGLVFFIILLALIIKINSMSLVTETMLLLCVALGIIFYINYCSFFTHAYNELISLFAVADPKEKENVFNRLKLKNCCTSRRTGEPKNF